MEQWAQIADSHYSVSSEGRVRNDNNGKIKSLVNTGDGYYHTDLYSEGKRETKKVHRLVAEAFIPNPDNKPQVNHKDGNKHNNNMGNLEWVDNSENMIHAFKNGLIKPHATYGMRGHKNPNGGAKGKPIICIETGQWYKNAAEAERQTGISDTCIFDCLKGRCSHAHHLHFQYA